MKFKIFLALFAAVPVVAHAGGYAEPDPEVRERAERIIQAPNTEPDPVVLTTRSYEEPNYDNDDDYYDHTLVVGMVSNENFDIDNYDELSDFTTEDGDLDINSSGYVKYVGAGEGLSPVLGVKFGDIVGFNFGVGYEVNIFKPYLGLSTNHPEEYFRDVVVGAFAGTTVKLPFSFALDFGAEMASIDAGGDSDFLPFIGIGYRF